jgi:solute:Na+ symporter, SSS family
MLNQLSYLDITLLILLILIINFGSIFFGFFKKKTSEDYFMAGRSLRWWSVAGSIYGTNVSVQQIIGMMGVGYSIGFAQSHYEVLAIPAILALAYIFIPLYRRQQVFTLSEWLGARYTDGAKTAYSILNILFILILLVGGFYLGARTLCLFFQGSAFEMSYLSALLVIASVTCLFSVFGGMESVVIADNIQTVLMVLAVVTVGTLAFLQPEINGFSGLLALDRSMPIAEQKMHLYLPANHPKLPWTGVFSGLMILHFFFWTTNQYQVQRVLAAASDRDARLGTIVAGGLKLTIPFFTVAAGVAAFYIFKQRQPNNMPLPDDVYLNLMNLVVAPQYLGLKGLILAGLISAIFATIYSMMNSLSTMLSMDIYRKFINTQALDNQIVTFGKRSIMVAASLALALAYFTFSPNSKDNIFLTMSAWTSYLKPGIVVTFVMGILWKNVNPRTAVVTMLAAPVFGVIIEKMYSYFFNEKTSNVVPMFGYQLNFMHRVFLVFGFCILLQVILSKIWKNEEKTDISSMTLPIAEIARKVLIFSVLQLPFLFILIFNLVPPQYLALPAAAVTFGQFIYEKNKLKTSPEHRNLWSSDLFYAALLASFTVWILYYFA